MTRSRSFSRSSARFGRWLSSNAPDSTRMMSGRSRSTSVNGRPMSSGRRRQREDPVRLVVHQRERAVAADGDHAVAHAADDVAEEPIVRGQARATAGRRSGRGRDGGGSSGAAARASDRCGMSGIAAATGTDRSRGKGCARSLGGYRSTETARNFRRLG